MAPEKSAAGIELAWEGDYQLWQIHSMLRSAYGSTFGKGGGNRGERNEILFLSLVLFLWRLRLLFLGVYRMYYAEFLLLWHDEKKMLEKMAPKDV